jgi:hypothetical protein
MPSISNTLRLYRTGMHQLCRAWSDQLASLIPLLTSYNVQLCINPHPVECQLSAGAAPLCLSGRSVVD